MGGNEQTPSYASAREHLSVFVGNKVLDITQHDEAFFREMPTMAH